MATHNIPERISFASSNKVIEYPDFLDIQVKSFKDFFQIGTSSENRSDEGLYKVFDENFPIADFHFQLSIVINRQLSKFTQQVAYISKYIAKYFPRGYKNWCGGAFF